MNYTKIYYSIVDRAKSRKIDGYKERHHIIPRSLGGTNDRNNIVSLTAREHFMCHLLLTKIHKDDSMKYRKCVNAFIMMMCESEKNKRYMPSRVYAKLKEDFSRIQSESQSGIGNSQYGTMWIHCIELRQSKKLRRLILFRMDGK